MSPTPALNFSMPPIRDGRMFLAAVRKEFMEASALNPSCGVLVCIFRRAAEKFPLAPSNPPLIRVEEDRMDIGTIVVSPRMCEYPYRGIPSRETRLLLALPPRTYMVTVSSAPVVIPGSV